jgi:(p)ppGpp synthase/HD superfamily hydrolase
MPPISANWPFRRLRRAVLDCRLPAFVQGLPLTAAALSYAEALHAGQRRPVDGTPFILHPLEVASLLYYARASDQVVAAGVLHDVIEDTSAAAGDLRRRFGARVTNLVVAVSEDDRIADHDIRKAALRAQVAASGHDALLLFAADKISKVRALRAASARNIRSDVADDYAEKIRHYHRSAEVLEELEPDAGLVHALREELDLLDTELARASQPVG